jgi:hypothetical protein
MLARFHWFQGELFSLIVDDLLRFPAEPGVIAEGLPAAAGEVGAC